ncbi:hypothetical protein DP112_06275 [Streptococcus suis]|nr:hypothetical protein DP112_06275 [Streptococcus suis]HEM3528223.1 23S rRNA methyltransferase attenuation leader peptide [Streptococcus suis]HEM3529667.1 23S rRNA methyltransferase attenuation leader peptide [Streptococcus suis]
MKQTKNSDYTDK